MALTRNAQLVALTFFQFGNNAEVHFANRKKINPKIIQGLNELVSSGHVSLERGGNYRWSSHYVPAKQYEPMKEEESMNVYR